MTTLARFLLAAIGGIPMLVLAGTVLAVWIDPPGPQAATWLRAAATLVFFEFLLLHSGAFMAVGPIVCRRVWLRLLWFVGFGLVYGFSLVGYARWTGADWMLWALLGVLLSRTITLVVLRDKRGTILMLQRSAVGITILLLTILVFFLPLPSLGITEELRYRAFGAAHDYLRAHPERALAWGALYFLLMAVVEAIAGWHAPNWTEEEVNRTWEALRK